MKYKCLITSILLMSVLSCTKVPVTGRKQLKLVPNSELQSLSYTNYRQFLSENKISGDQAATAMVKNVGNRIKQGVETYMRQNNMSDRLEGFAWEFNLVEDPAVNAWCMPGGKVVVYTGLLPITQDETGLAVVMGHEIAHAIANHGGERMSQQLAQQLGGVALSVAVRDQPAATQNIFLTSYNVGSTVGLMLPYSRLHESEADRMGLIFMALAGYDPAQAIPFWQRMASMSKGQKPPQFLSTHPSDETRVRDLQKALPEAQKYYKPR